MKDIRGRTELGGRFWALRRFLLWGLLGVAVLAAAVWAAQLWWHWMYPVAQFRYKLTVEVMTPDGLKSGSSVIEVRYSSGHPLPNPGRAYNDRVVAGEAVYVDLGQGRNLFVLLGTMMVGRGYQGNWEFTNTAVAQYERPARGPLGVLDLPERVFVFQRSPGEEVKITNRVAELRGQPPETVKNIMQLPTLVTFASLQDPESVRVVQPNALEEMLGPGYRLDQVTLQITDDDVTKRIEGILPWLPSKRLPDGRMEFSVRDNLIDQLGYASFKMPP